MCVKCHFKMFSFSFVGEWCKLPFKKVKKILIIPFSTLGLIVETVVSTNLYIWEKLIQDKSFYFIPFCF